MATLLQESMYMYLASVDSSHLFSDNNPSSFRAKLPQPLYFENPSDWEIALKSYIGPVLHANLEENSCFYVIHHDKKYYKNKKLPVVEEIKIPEIYYHSIDHLVDTINHSCRSIGREIRLSILNDRVSVVVEEDNCGILFKKYLAGILGFANATFVFSNFTVISDETCFVSSQTEPTVMVESQQQQQQQQQSSLPQSSSTVHD